MTNELSTYQEYRALLVKEHYQDSVSFDKLLTTVASSALGLSISFYDDIIRTPIPWTLLALIVSWILFAASLLFILLSYLASMQGRMSLIEQIDEFLVDENSSDWSTSAKTQKLNIAAVLSLILGILAFVVYVIANIL